MASLEGSNIRVRRTGGAGRNVFVTDSNGCETKVVVRDIFYDNKDSHFVHVIRDVLLPQSIVNAIASLSVPFTPCTAKRAEIKK